MNLENRIASELPASTPFHRPQLQSFPLTFFTSTWILPLLAHPGKTTSLIPSSTQALLHWLGFLSHARNMFSQNIFILFSSLLLKFHYFSELQLNLPGRLIKDYTSTQDICITSLSNPHHFCFTTYPYKRLQINALLWSFDHAVLIEGLRNVRGYHH